MKGNVICSSSWSIQKELKGEAQAEVVVPVRRVIPVPIRNGAVGGIVVPTATTIDAVRSYIDNIS